MIKFKQAYDRALRTSGTDNPRGMEVMDTSRCPNCGFRGVRKTKNTAECSNDNCRVMTFIGKVIHADH